MVGALQMMAHRLMVHIPQVEVLLQEVKQQEQATEIHTPTQLHLLVLQELFYLRTMLFATL
jgi:hypothetical protein